MRKIAIIPVHNEENCVIAVLDEAIKYVDFLIVIDDNSSVFSKKKIENWNRVKNKAYVLFWPHRIGKAAVIKKGFYIVDYLYRMNLLSEDDIVINIDGDGQHLPEYIPQLTQYAEENKFDVVITRRRFSSYPFSRKIANKLLSLIATFLSGYEYYDSESGFRCLKVKTILRILEYYSGFRYSDSQEIAVGTARLGFKVNNNFICGSDPYILGETTIRDFVINIIMGTIMMLRIIFKIKKINYANGCYLQEILKVWKKYME